VIEVGATGIETVLGGIAAQEMVQAMLTQRTGLGVTDGIAFIGLLGEDLLAIGVYCLLLFHNCVI
jgi:hypothetical protein